MTKECACVIKTSVTKIKIEENGKKAVFLNPKRRKFQKIAFDGCIVKNQTACDWIVMDEDVGFVMVELKGRDVEHALIQLKASIDYIRENLDYPQRFAGLIVCGGVRRSPKFTSAQQSLKNKFNKLYKAPVHIVVGDYDFHMENILSHRGPHKL